MLSGRVGLIRFAAAVAGGVVLVVLAVGLVGAGLLTSKHHVTRSCSTVMSGMINHAAGTWYVDVPSPAVTDDTLGGYNFVVPALWSGGTLQASDWNLGSWWFYEDCGSGDVQLASGGVKGVISAGVRDVWLSPGCSYRFKFTTSRELHDSGGGYLQYCSLSPDTLGTMPTNCELLRVVGPIKASSDYAVTVPISRSYTGFAYRFIQYTGEVNGGGGTTGSLNVNGIGSFNFPFQAPVSPDWGTYGFQLEYSDVLSGSSVAAGNIYWNLKRYGNSSPYYPLAELWGCDADIVPDAPYSSDCLNPDPELSTLGIDGSPWTCVSPMCAIVGDTAVITVPALAGHWGTFSGDFEGLQDYTETVKVEIDYQTQQLFGVAMPAHAEYSEAGSVLESRVLMSAGLDTWVVPSHLPVGQAGADMIIDVYDGAGALIIDRVCVVPAISSTDFLTGTVPYSPYLYLPFTNTLAYQPTFTGPVNYGSECFPLGFTIPAAICTATGACSPGDGFGLEVCVRQWGFEVGALGMNLSTVTLVYLVMAAMVVMWIRTS